jgi:hypothetical protein
MRPISAIRALRKRMKKTSTEKAINPTKQVATNSFLMADGNKLSHVIKAHRLFIKSVFLYRKSLSKFRFWLIDNSPTLFFSTLYKYCYQFASLLTPLVSKILGATNVRTGGSFAKKHSSDFIPLVSDIDLNIFFDKDIKRSKLFAFDFLVACFPFLSIHIQHNRSYSIISSLLHHSKIEDFYLKDWKAWRILTKILPQYFAHNQQGQRIFLHTSLLAHAGMMENDRSTIINSRRHFHQLRRSAINCKTIWKDWAHILRSLPTNSKLEEVTYWEGAFEGLTEIHFTDEEKRQFSEVFRLGAISILIDYHPWRYQDKHTLWITGNEVSGDTIEHLSHYYTKMSFPITKYYNSYPTPIIICEKHLANSYLPKMAYLPRYKIKSDLSIESTKPNVWPKSLVAEVIYETTLLLTDVWKMGRDRFARGRINDLVDGLIPGLILLLNHNVFVGNINDIQKRFRELYPHHPLWNLQQEIRKPRPDITRVHNLFSPVLEELRKAILRTGS